MAAGFLENPPAGKRLPLETVIPYLIVCPLVFIAGFVDAVAGGGGLISLPAYMLSGIPVHMAIGTNKLSSGMGTALATFRYARSGYIRWKLAVYCVISALIGSACGAELALLIDDGVFKIIMLVILPLTAAYVLSGKALAAGEEKGDLPQWKVTLISMVVALVIGAYDGFYGPGTGTFLILLLTGLAHMRLSEANGIAKTINLSTNVAALTVYLFNGKVIFPLGCAFCPAAEAPIAEAISSGNGMRLSNIFRPGGRNPSGLSASAHTRCSTPMVSLRPHTGHFPSKRSVSSGVRHTPQFLWPSRWYFPSSGKNSIVPRNPSPVWMAWRNAG